MSRPVRKVIGAVLITLNFLTLANIAWVRMDYATKMPTVPDPSSGRVQAVYASHGRVYVTPEEARKLYRANNVATLFAFLALIGVYIAVGVRKVERRS